jgi:hypothetical protein
MRPMTFDPLRRLVIPCLAALLVGACGPGDPAAARPTSSVALDVPAAPGSVGPRLASGDGTLVLSWIEPADGGHALRFAVLGEAGWGATQTVARGADWFANWADFPSVTPLSPELWAAHWLVSQPAGGYAYDVRVSLSTNRGASWSDPLLPHDDGTETEHGFVTLFPRAGGAGLVWLDGRRMSGVAAPGTPEHGTEHGMTVRSAVVTLDGRITEPAEVDALTCDCCHTDVAVASSAVVAVYRDRTADEIRDIAAARLGESGWEPPRPVAADGWHIAGCPVNAPAIVAAGDRLAVAWYTAANDIPRIRLARSADAGLTWSAPVDVAVADLEGRAGIAWLADDRLAVSWMCTRPGGSAVCLRSVSPAGELGPVQVVSGAARVPVLSVPQIAHHGDRLVLAWTEESAGNTRIASAALPVDSLP